MNIIIQHLGWDQTFFYQKLVATFELYILPILDQLGLDRTFFVQLVIFFILFIFLRITFFSPFQKLLNLRKEKIEMARIRAEKLLLDAKTKAQEYEQKISEEFKLAKAEMNEMITQVRGEEQKLLQEARAQAKKLNQEVNDTLMAQKVAIKKQLEVDVQSLAHNISERLLLRKT